MLLFGHPAPSIQFNVATDAIGGMEGLGLALRFLKLDSDKVSRRSAPSGPDEYVSLHVGKGLLSINVGRLVESRRMAQSHLRRLRSRRRRPSWSSRTPSASTPTPVSQSAGLSIRYAASANRLPPRHPRCPAVCRCGGRAPHEHRAAAAHAAHHGGRASCGASGAPARPKVPAALPAAPGRGLWLQCQRHLPRRAHVHLPLHLVGASIVTNGTSTATTQCVSL